MVRLRRECFPAVVNRSGMVVSGIACFRQGRRSGCAPPVDRGGLRVYPGVTRKEWRYS